MSFAKQSLSDCFLAYSVPHHRPSVLLGRRGHGVSLSVLPRRALCPLSSNQSSLLSSWTHAMDSPPGPLVFLPSPPCLDPPQRIFNFGYFIFNSKHSTPFIFISFASVLRLSILPFVSRRFLNVLTYKSIFIMAA